MGPLWNSLLLLEADQERQAWASLCSVTAHMWGETNRPILWPLLPLDQPQERKTEVSILATG